MSSIVSGDPAQASTSLAKTVTNATNAVPIVVTTSTPHTFRTGMHVVVEDVGGNDAANGEFAITVVDATHFSLDGSGGSGAYTSGGTVTCISLTPSFQVPSDGDGPGIKAADVVPALECLAHWCQALALMAGQRLQRMNITASTDWVVPSDVSFIWGTAWGGGGGGGGGGAQSTGATGGCGGGGGGGAQGKPFFLSVSAGDPMHFEVGAGGAGGAGGVNTAGANGSAGGDSKIQLGSDLFVAHGAGGGTGGAEQTDNTRRLAYGGKPNRLLQASKAADVSTGEVLGNALPGQGGCGYNYPHAGGPLLVGYVQNGSPSGTGPGGAGGANGADSTGTQAGGGGGGGGGGGASDAVGAEGGAGGGGGQGSNSDDVNAAPGSDGASGTGWGAGGGGGGGGGTMNVVSSGENGGAGAAGNAGGFIVFFISRAP